MKFILLFFTTYICVSAHASYFALENDPNYTGKTSDVVVKRNIENLMKNKNLDEGFEDEFANITKGNQKTYLFKSVDKFKSLLMDKGTTSKGVKNLISFFSKYFSEEEMARYIDTTISQILNDVNNFDDEIVIDSVNKLLKVRDNSHNSLGVSRNCNIIYATEKEHTMYTIIHFDDTNPEHNYPIIMSKYIHALNNTITKDSDLDEECPDKVGSIRDRLKKIDLLSKINLDQNRKELHAVTPSMNRTPSTTYETIEGLQGVFRVTVEYNSDCSIEEVTPIKDESINRLQIAKKEKKYGPSTEVIYVAGKGGKCQTLVQLQRVETPCPDPQYTSPENKLVMDWGRNFMNAINAQQLVQINN